MQLVNGVPADVEIHRMHRVLDDLPRHCEEMRIVDEERLVQEWEKANGGEKQCRPRAGQHSDCRNRRPGATRSFVTSVFMFASVRVVFIFRDRMQWDGG